MMKDKYIIAITTLSILLLISVIIIGILGAIATDLRDTVNMYKNTIGVCRIDLEEVQNENKELREDLEKRCEKQYK